MTEEEKPLTREDVIRLIEEHGGPQRLDLSNRNLKGIDLSPTEDGTVLDLHGIILRNANLEGAKLQRALLLYANLQESRIWNANLQGAVLEYTNLQGADLLQANLQEAELIRANLQQARLTDANMQGAFLPYANLQGADLRMANLQGAFLQDANLQGANLVNANLKGATLEEAKLQGADLRYASLSKAKLYESEISRETKLDNVEWGPKYIIGDEEEGRGYKYAQELYRNLKQWHTEAGIYNIAGEFYFREMTLRRKVIKWWPNPLPRALSKFISILCGYGEKPFRVVASAAVVVFSMAAIYSISALSFPSALYYSASSFTALGYGLWVSAPEGWVKALGAAEAFAGVFVMALFLITFIRKMTR